MEYPKEVMRLKDLVTMGFPEDYLLRIYRSRNQKIAWKTGNKINCPILFDTKELEKYRRAQCVGGHGREI